MKLLLDQNLSRRLLPVLIPHFPDSSQVALLGMEMASDQEIWAVARQAGYAIVTKDADFVELALLKGWPPKIIRLDLGNVRNEVVETCLLKHRAAIADFLVSDHDGVLQID